MVIKVRAILEEVRRWRPFSFEPIGERVVIR
jgi:hypothetical protein